MKPVVRRLLLAVVVVALLLSAGAGAFYLFLKETTHEVAIDSVAAIDSANTITDPNWFKKAHDDGYALYVIHSTAWGTCAPWEHTQAQLKMALDAGMKIAAYTRNPDCYKQGIEAAGPYKDDLQFFALDIETDPGIPVTRAMVDGVKAMGVRPVIYTGSGMWRQLQGEKEDFADVPLWDTSATYGALPDGWEPDVGIPKAVAYGGWNTVDNLRVAVQQYFEYTLHGVKVDVNSFARSFLK